MKQKIIAAGVLPLCPRTGRVLLNLRGEDQPDPLTWSCWGGKYEDGIDQGPKSCAKREFREESRNILPYKISKNELHCFDSNHLQFWTYLGVFDREFCPDIEAEGEAASWGWFSLDKLPEPLHPEFGEMMCDKLDFLKQVCKKFK